MLIYEEINDLHLLITSDILDMSEISCDDESCWIPLIRNDKDKEKYDKIYHHILSSVDSPILNYQPELTLDIISTPLGYDCYLLVNAESLDGDETILSPISLSYKEIDTILPIIKKQFQEYDLDELRKGTMYSIEQSVSCKPMFLFGDNVMDNTYYSVWLSLDKTRCILSEVKNINSEGKFAEVILF